MKGIIFAGDSFTWGQGVHYYSELPNIQFPLNNYNREYLTNAHISYKDSQRWVRYVAHYFKTFELVSPINGGSDINSLEFIDFIWKNGYNYDDISYVVFQTTQFIRSPFKFTYKGNEYDMSITWYDFLSTEIKEVVDGWLIENNSTFEEFELLYKMQVLERIKVKFRSLEENGIKCMIMCWPPDYLDLILNDGYIKERFIPINYKDTEYLCMEHMMHTHPETVIYTDPTLPTSHQTGDLHISMTGHTAVANSVIKKIESYELARIHAI